MRTSVDYITAASHSGKSASVVVGFLRSRELDSGDDARLNFTHYLYMLFANNGGNYHARVCEAKLQRACGGDDELRAALGAAYMRDCFRAQTFGFRRFCRRLRLFLRLPCEETTYLRAWKPGAFPIFQRTKDMLEKDVSTFIQRSPKGVLLVHVDEYGSMCPDSRPRHPERCHESTCRASWSPGLGNLH